MNARKQKSTNELRLDRVFYKSKDESGYLSTKKYTDDLIKNATNSLFSDLRSAYEKVNSTIAELMISESKNKALEASNLKLVAELCNATGLEHHCKGVTLLKQPLHDLCAVGYLHQDIPCTDNEDGRDSSHWKTPSIVGDLDGYCCDN